MAENSRTSIEQLKNYIGQQVTLSGWMYKNRPSGKVQFLMLRDGSGLCQCIIERDNLSDDLFGQIKHLGQESSLSVTGQIREEPPDCTAGRDAYRQRQV